MDHPFRSAMFGGFNRQDVLEYLENSAQQAVRQQQELQAQLDQARQELTDRQSQESDGQEQLEKARQEAEALQSQLDQANADLTVSRETVSRLSEELEQARQDNAEAMFSGHDIPAEKAAAMQRFVQEVLQACRKKRNPLQRFADRWFHIWY